VTRPVLHLVNGDHAARAVAQAGLGEVAIVWRDVLHDGPVQDLSDDMLARSRAAFIAAAGWGSEAAAAAAFGKRDRRLQQAFSSPVELVLWFAPGLHDQLQRLQVLARAARCGGLKATISEAALAGQAGLLDPPGLSSAFERRCEAGPSALARALEGWLAFTDGDAGRLDRLLEADDCDAPLLDAAIRRWREEFPALAGGLSRTERNVLEALGRGVFRAREVHVAACHHAEEVVFQADVPFASVLCRLSSGEAPLLSHPDQRPVTMAALAAGERVFWNDSLLITRAGRECLAGQRDWMAQASARSMGGVRLEGPAGWRWDAAANRMHRMPAG